MFNTAFVLVDEMARPILIIPENLPAGDTFLNIVEGGIDIGVGEKVFGQIRDMEDAPLAMLGLQEEIGMATFLGETEKEEMPETIQYVARVKDTRNF